MQKIRLEPFSAQSSELVLSWRNSDRVRLNSIDDSVIDATAHESFLKVLSEDSSKRYFVVYLNETAVAVISFNGIGGQTVIWGCYIGSDKVMPGLFSLLVGLAVKVAFHFPNTEFLESEVAKHNKSPQTLNAFLGIEKTGVVTKTTSSGRPIEFIQYLLSRGQVDQALSKVRKTLTVSMRNLIDQFEVKT